MNDDNFEKLRRHLEIVLLLEMTLNAIVVIGVIGLFLLLAICSLLVVIVTKL